MKDEVNYEKEMLVGLGEIIVLFTEIEFVVKNILVRMITNDLRLGWVLLAENNFQSSKEMLKKVFYYHVENEEIRKEFNRLYDLLGRSQGRRNDVAHSKYYVEQEFTDDFSGIGKRIVREYLEKKRG